MASVRPRRLQVHYAVQFTHEDGVTGQGTMVNVSMKGCAIQSDTQVFEEMLVTLQFSPAEGAVPVSIEMGRVTWATLHEFGVEFLMILPQERSRLERVLLAAASSASPSAAA